MLRPHPSLPHPWAEAADPDLDALPDWTRDPSPPVIWSVAGTDSGGGAGLSADTRAALALGVHLCPVVACVTAQNSLGLQSLHVQPAEVLDAQMQALAQDLRPRVVKTGLLGSPEAVHALARRVDALRRQGPVRLVVDPVLGATAGGARFDHAALVQAYVDELLPRCDVLTPNRKEAERLCGAKHDDLSTPELATRLRALGAVAVCITGGDEVPPGAKAELALDWTDCGEQSPVPEVRGWLALPRLQQPLDHHGSGCTFATGTAAALARGFALPDALILAKMMTWAALRDGHRAGRGAGPLRPLADFISNPRALPVLGWAHEARPDPETQARWLQVLDGGQQRSLTPGLYGIDADSATLAAHALAGHFAHLQLRSKTEPGLVGERIGQALIACGGLVQLWINDHAALALDRGADALHLGQEDWAALDPALRHRIQVGLKSGALKLGLSSHSLWELARARGIAPDYIACGPIWPTTTKKMPWSAQGLAQLRWWARMAGTSVVAIGGITSQARLEQVRNCDVASAALVRRLDLAEQALA